MYYVIKAGIIPNYLLFMVYENQGLKEKKKAFFALPVTLLWEPVTMTMIATDL